MIAGCGSDKAGCIYPEQGQAKAQNQPEQPKADAEQMPTQYRAGQNQIQDQVRRTARYQGGCRASQNQILNQNWEIVPDPQ
jgi:hypothetical protein